MQDHFAVLEKNDLVEHALDVSDQMGREQDRKRPRCNLQRMVFKM